MYPGPDMAAATRTYHHGNLRSVLLARAEEALNAGEDLSLRELARRAGVSHAAPRRHFADKQALLDALAEDGFSGSESCWRRPRPAPTSPRGCWVSPAPTWASPSSTRRCSS